MTTPVVNVADGVGRPPRGELVEGPAGGRMYVVVPGRDGASWAVCRVDTEPAAVTDHAYEARRWIREHG